MRGASQIRIINVNFCTFECYLIVLYFSWYMSQNWAALEGGDTLTNHIQAEHRSSIRQPIRMLTIKALSQWHANLTRNEWLARHHLPMLPIVVTYTPFLYSFKLLLFLLSYIL